MKGDVRSTIVKGLDANDPDTSTTITETLREEAHDHYSYIVSPTFGVQQTGQFTLTIVGETNGVAGINFTTHTIGIDVCMASLQTWGLSWIASLQSNLHQNSEDADLMWWLVPVLWHGYSSGEDGQKT